MGKSIPWLKENEDKLHIPLICDHKSLVDAVGNSHEPEEGMRLVQTAIARLNTENYIEVLRVPGHCGPMGNELAEKEAKLGLKEYQPSIALYPDTR